MATTPDTPPNLDHSAIRRLLHAHAPVNNKAFPSIDLPTALHTQAKLTSQQSSIPAHIKSQGERIYKDWQKILEPMPNQPGSYVITDDILRGLIAHTGILASMQAILESASGLLKHAETADLEHLVPPSVAEQKDADQPTAT